MKGRIGRRKNETYPALLAGLDVAIAEALSAFCGAPSVVMMGFNSFFLFLLAFPLEAVLATCFAFWMAACLICDPFMILMLMCAQRKEWGEDCCCCASSETVLYDAGAKKGRAGDADFINNASRSTLVKIYISSCVCGSTRMDATKNRTFLQTDEGAATFSSSRSWLGFGWWRG